MHFTLLAISFFIYILHTATCEEKCFSMYCHQDTDKESACMKVIQTEAPGIYKVGFRSCENQRLSYCNVYDGLIQPSNFNSKCEERFKVIQSYPGGQCTNSSHCLYGICINNVCKDSDRDQFCLRDESCPIGTACIENNNAKRCLDLRQKFENCNKTTDCEFNLFCSYGVCMTMFDYEDNDDISLFKQDNVERLDLLCKSGFAGEINQKTFCLSLKNVKKEKDKCNEDCEYKIGDTIMTIPDTCKCGFNSQRSKHCILGSGEEAYVNYMLLKTQLFNDTSYTRYCHTVERFNEGYCVEKIKSDRSMDTRRKIRDYNNMRIDALEHHRLMHSDECIKNVVFDYDTSPLVPDQRQCASFSCDKSLTTCLYGVNPLNDAGSNVKINLNENKCEGNEVCIVDQTKGIEFIYENDTMTGECKEKLNGLLRLPGEDCNRPEDCINHNCDANSKCAGKNVNEECSSHIDCLKGLYCSKGRCQMQRKESEPCDSGWDCLNNLGCYSNPTTLENQCLQFGSIVNIDISQMVSKWPSDPKVHKGYDTNELGTGLMCKTGQISVSKTRCSEYSYDKSHIEMAKENSEQFIACKADSLCYYLDSFKGNSNRSCECGYNSEGIGYCPLPNTINKEDWLKMYDLKRELTDNQCHSLSRFNCYLNSESKAINELEFKTTKAHLFYNAVPCAYKVLSSKWVMISYNSFALIILLLI